MAFRDQFEQSAKVGPGLKSIIKRLDPATPGNAPVLTTRVRLRSPDTVFPGLKGTGQLRDAHDLSLNGLKELIDNLNVEAVTAAVNPRHIAPRSRQK